MPLSGSHTWSGAGQVTASCAEAIASVAAVTTERLVLRSYYGPGPASRGQYR
ncbi:hypothetical protein FHX71_003286 [Promicromonospora sukumoe]|uniref:Uncharacterized protein n=1 Tax=Promicromonospora sukumoe TaxID=88382 RepID=A0A7W3JAS5_9MICO|nr:hypothetical protein [Promicromonospora sukumoe]